MRAVMLAAGVGSRLRAGARESDHPPKVLLEFSGRSLLRRHVDCLRSLGIEELVMVTGYRAADIEAEIGRAGVRDFVRTVHNPDYRQGSVVSLSVAGPAMTGDDDVLLMDADVLYHPRVVACLVETRHANCFLMDREFEGGEEPVKICLRGGEIVEFRKRVSAPFDEQGESVGFFRLSPPVAAAVASAGSRYVVEGRAGEPYEEAIRDVLLASSPGTFGYEDVSGLPWIEIDFPEDVDRAASDVLPRIEGPRP